MAQNWSPMVPACSLHFLKLFRSIFFLLVCSFFQKLPGSVLTTCKRYAVPPLQIPAASKAPNIFFRRLFVSPLFDSYCFSRLLTEDQINAVIFLAFTDSKRLESARKKWADIQVVPTPNPAWISTLFPAHALAYPGSRVQTTPTPTALKTPNNTLLDRTGSHTSAKRQFWVFSRPPAKRYGVLLTFIWCACRVFRSFQKSWLGHIVKQQKSDVLEYAGEQRSVCKSFKHTRVDSEKQTVD